MKLTTSELRTYQRCREEHRWRYVRRMVPTAPPSTALGLGTAIHAGLEVWWRTGSETPHLMLEAYARSARAVELDPYETVRGEVMLSRYHLQWRWEQSAYIVRGVEEAFARPRTWGEFGGKLDALVETSVIPRQLLVVEHKTTSDEVTPGSDYWRKLSVDNQLANYLIASGADGVLWDAIRKPSLRPGRATPVEQRRRRKDGALYAGQREEDEPLDDWRRRLEEAYDAEPGTWFGRQLIRRTSAELVTAGRHLDELASDALRSYAAPEVSQPRNQEACTRYGRPCDYQALCYGEQAVEDAVMSGRLRVLADPHVELQ